MEIITAQFDPLLNPAPQEEGDVIHITIDQPPNRNTYDVMQETTTTMDYTPSPWLTCFCVVNFDIEIGPKLEATLPSTEFSTEEQKNLSFTSFPDTNISGLSKDVVFSFRNTRRLRNQKSEHYYGYVFFRQQKDESSARGYIQKSIVLISPYPFLGLYSRMVSIVGPMYFDYGMPAVEAAFQNISSWPDLVYGGSFDLPFMGSVFSYQVPHSHSIHAIDPKIKQIAAALPQQPPTTEMSKLHAVDLYQSFSGMYSKLWTLWELILTGESLLVLAPSPTESSAAVLGLVNLISPIPYGGEFRPFFTIHDSEFKNFTSPSSTTNKAPPVILGVTNPFFHHSWSSHLAVVGDFQQKSPQKSSPKGMTLKSDLRSDYKPLLKVDNKEVLSQLQNATDQEAMNEIISRHFYHITENFLVPFERYFATLMPLAKRVSLVNDLPSLKHFKSAEFLSQLSTYKSTLFIGKKSDELEAYTRFLLSPSFKLWYRARRKQANDKLYSMYVSAILDTNVRDLLKNKGEVEIMDFYLRVKDQIKNVSKKAKAQELVAKLESHLQSILSHLPQDVQQSITFANSSPVITTRLPLAATI